MAVDDSGSQTGSRSRSASRVIWLCGVVERARRQPGPHLLAAGRLQIVDLEDGAVRRRSRRVDQRELAVVGDAADQVHLLQRVAEHRAGKSAQHRHAAVVRADVVVAADQAAADHEGRTPTTTIRPSASSSPAHPVTLLLRSAVPACGGDSRRGGARRTHRGGAAGGGVRRRGVLFVVGGGGARDDGVALPVVEVDDVRHDDRDVVRAAAAQGEFDEPVGALVLRALAHRVLDGLVADHVGQSVGAQQVAVAGARLADGQRRLDLVAGERAHDQRPLRVGVRLLGGDPALVDQGLDERVVPGDLRQRVVAEQVGAGVADVDQAELVAGEQDRGERGAHAVEFGVLLDVVGDGVVALAGGGLELAEQVFAGLVVVEMREGGDHQLRRDLTGRVAAHAVGERQQAGAGVHGIFVVGADKTTVAAGRVAENKGHGRSSITVLPTRTGVPSGTRTAVVTLARSR